MKKLFRKKSISRILRDVKSGYGDGEGHEMNKVLGVRDITFFGMAAIIGAGIFSSVGSACYNGGPAIITLFVGIAIACGFAAVCYAEMASRIPVAGSAYTYTYATFGELFAWIIGWDLIMEYAVGNVVVAISWSGNLTTFLGQIGVHIPDFLSHGYLEAKNGSIALSEALAQGKEITPFMKEMASLWESAPTIGSMPFIINLPAFLITALITAVVYIGIKESRAAANGMVIFKVLVVLLVIVIGAFYVRPENWDPFAPNGSTGVLKGVAAVFFAYIGFDALATVSEECKDPQRDLPRGMIYSLLIATTLYILVALVLTGMVKYTQLNNEAFLAQAFLERGVNWIGGVIAFSALIATASVMLVFQIGQPRIWMSMSRDGLLPGKFSKIHKRYKTPAFATIVTGILVGVPALFMDAEFVTDMTSIGTLFAFALVCGGVLVLHQFKDEEKPKFKVPYINGRWFMLLLLAGILGWFNATMNEEGSTAFNLLDIRGGWHGILNDQGAVEIAGIKTKVLSYIFYLGLILLTILSYIKRLSLIPMLGLVCCLYFLSTLDATNWIRFIVWLVIGIVIYLVYSRNKSKLNEPT